MPLLARENFRLERKTFGKYILVLLLSVGLCLWRLKSLMYLYKNLIYISHSVIFESIRSLRDAILNQSTTRLAVNMIKEFNKIEIKSI